MMLLRNAAPSLPVHQLHTHAVMPKRKSILAQVRGIAKTPKPRRHQQIPDLQLAAADQAAPLKCASHVDLQAADIVQRILHAHATGRHGSSVKSLCLAAAVRAKGAVFAVVTNTLANVRPLAAVRKELGLVAHGGLSEATALVLLYELLLGQGFPTQQGPAEQLVASMSDAARSAFASQQQTAPTADRQPRCVRVNTLKVSTEAGFELLRTLAGDQRSQELEDALLPDVALLPAGHDLHGHPAVQDGRLVLQVACC